jgi:hypothetical protein
MHLKTKKQRINRIRKIRPTASNSTFLLDGLSVVSLMNEPEETCP